MEWYNDESDRKEIVMTVGLPVYRGEKIIWLALESLKNQYGIDFGWELIIWEEGGKSLELLMEYLGKLPLCQRIVHKNLDKKLLLIDKWRGISKDASETSKIFVFQDADDYSPMCRLNIHKSHFEKSNCYYSTQPFGLFVNLRNGGKIFYNGLLKENSRSRNFTRNHLNKAIRTRDMKRIPSVKINKNVDFYIFNMVQRLNGIRFTGLGKKYIFTDLENNIENWKSGFFTDGFNSISGERRMNYSIPRSPFQSYMINNKFSYKDMSEYVPENVIKFINDIKIM